MHPADARGVNRSTAPHQRRNAAKCVPNEMARGQKASSSLPQQVEFVKQSIKLRQARQNQPTVKKESPTNRKQVQSTIFVMHYNCKIFWCFYSVRLKFNWGLIGFTFTLHCVGPTAALDARSICVSVVNTSEDNKENGEGNEKAEQSLYLFGPRWKSMRLCRPK